MIPRGVVVMLVILSLMVVPLLVAATSASAPQVVDGIADALTSLMAGGGGTDGLGVPEAYVYTLVGTVCAAVVTVCWTMCGATHVAAAQTAKCDDDNGKDVKKGSPPSVDTITSRALKNKNGKGGKVEKEKGCGESKGADIEDLGSKLPPATRRSTAPAVPRRRTSLVPITVKRMKSEGVVAYTKEQREGMLSELNTTSSLVLPNFRSQVTKRSPLKGDALKRVPAKVFQLNIGLFCNQACTHCHVDSSPNRKEMMSHAVAEKCVSIIKNSPSVQTIDITGGAPELNREFRYIVKECSSLGLDLIDRCNLTVLLEPNQKDLADFLAEHGVHIIASLPCYLETNVDGQRGDQVFQRSIQALQLLNAVGYGVEGSTNKAGKPLRLDLVYNPTGIHLPPPAEKLEGAYKEKLSSEFGIVFNSLHCITNMPINRFYDYLKGENKVDEYMKLLVDNFNPATTSDIMCKSYVSVKWDGELFDCDFNQQVDLSLKNKDSAKKGISVFDIESADDLLDVPIVTRMHCYGCTAGQGSS